MLIVFWIRIVPVAALALKPNTRSYSAPCAFVTERSGELAAEVETETFVANASVLVPNAAVAGPVPLDRTSIAIEVTDSAQPDGGVIENV